MSWDDPRGLLVPFGVFLDVIDRVLHGRDLLSVFIGNFNTEGFFESHHELDGVERIGAQIVHKGGRRGHFAFIHTELLDNNLLDAFINAGHSNHSSDFRMSRSPGKVPQAGVMPQYNLAILCVPPCRVNLWREILWRSIILDSPEPHCCYPMCMPPLTSRTWPVM